MVNCLLRSTLENPTFREILNLRMSSFLHSRKITNAHGSGNEGVYHEFNTLNNLTGKQWLKFLKSWFILNPRPRSKDVLLHPAKFPEELVESFVTFFTKKGQTVLDPMVGTGSTTVASFMNDRNSIGVELSRKYAETAAKRITMLVDGMENSKTARSSRATIRTRLLQGDARDLDRMAIDKIDYCITSPPYWNMLKAKGFETQAERRKANLDTDYSDDPRDVGNIEDYEEFLDRLVEIYLKVHDVLKPGGYLTVIVKNIKKKGKIYPLAWDLGNRLGNFFILKDEKIWCQDNTRLAPYGYGRCWVSNTVHHYCLTFRKDRLS